VKNAERATLGERRRTFFEEAAAADAHMLARGKEAARLKPISWRG